MTATTPVKIWQLLLLLALLPTSGWLAHKGTVESQSVLEARHRTETATTLKLNGDAAGAARELELALVADPTRYDTYHDLSGAYFTMFHDRDVCIAVYRRALVFLPQDPDVHQDLGRLYYLHGEYKAAIAELETAQRLGVKGEEELLAKARADESKLGD